MKGLLREFLMDGALSDLEEKQVIVLLFLVMIEESLSLRLEGYVCEGYVWVVEVEVRVVL